MWYSSTNTLSSNNTTSHQPTTRDERTDRKQTTKQTKLLKKTRGGPLCHHRGDGRDCNQQRTKSRRSTTFNSTGNVAFTLVLVLVGRAQATVRESYAPFCAVSWCGVVGGGWLVGGLVALQFTGWVVVGWLVGWLVNGKKRPRELDVPQP